MTFPTPIFDTSPRALRREGRLHLLIKLVLFVWMIVALILAQGAGA